MPLWQIWLIAAVVWFVGELLTEGFALFWFAVGSLAALVISFFVPNWIIQFSFFLIVSFVLFIFTRPLTQKFFESKNKTQSNIYSLVGMKAKVTESIDRINGTGKVKVNGETWKAVFENDEEEAAPVGSEVIIKAIDGVKLIVSKK